MSFAKVFAAETSLLDAHIIDVEVDLSRGLHSFSLVGLAGKAVDESKDRVAAAIKNTGFTSPKQHNQKIVVSLAPAELKKEGPLFDIAIALAYLLAEEEVSFNPEKKLFIGELSLDGKVRPVRGALRIAQKAQEAGFEELYVPKENTKEAGLVSGISVYGIETLRELLDHLAGKSPLTPVEQTPFEENLTSHNISFEDVRGQDVAKRALEIAAAGGHNVALYGPAGTGKSMLAKAFCTILPPLTYEDALEVTAIHSVAGALKDAYITTAPFRSPHHTSSHVSLIGGGSIPKPGEVTLAHKGVLFLDEFPEFDRRVIDSLRQPLEDGMVSISRAKGSAQFPANFTLVAALNPPSETIGQGVFTSERDLEKFRRKLSKPIVDRIDLWSEVAKVDHTVLSGEKTGRTSEEIRGKVLHARNLQQKRFKDLPHVHTNSDMSSREIEQLIVLPENIQTTLNASAEKLELSPRSYHKIIKLMRTIADLEGSEQLQENHLFEALQYRPKKELFE